MKIEFKRGLSGNLDYHKDKVLEGGEFYYITDTKEFIIGEKGKTLKEHKRINNLVTGEDGIVYGVWVDKDGKTHCSPTPIINNTTDYVLKD